MSNFNKDDYIYQSFWFKNEIKKHFYAGYGFITHRKSMNIKETYEH